MNRLRAALRHDIRLQARSGFYAAAAFVAVCLIPLLRTFDHTTLALVLPAFVLLNMQVNTFYFIGGLVLLEKAEGSVQALAVSPLRPQEYGASKVLSLALLSLVEAAVVVVATYGVRVQPLALAAGVVLAAILFCLFGFIAVARYDSINTFLMPSVGVATLLNLPVLDALGIWTGPLWLLHPIRAPLVLLEAAVHPVAAWRIGYALGYGALWALVLGWFSLAAWNRHIVGRGASV